MEKIFSAKWVKEAVDATIADENAHARPRCNEGCPYHRGGDHVGCDVARAMLARGEDY